MKTFLTTLILMIVSSFVFKANAQGATVDGVRFDGRHISTTVENKGQGDEKTLCGEKLINGFLEGKSNLISSFQVTAVKLSLTEYVGRVETTGIFFKETRKWQELVERPSFTFLVTDSQNNVLKGKLYAHAYEVHRSPADPTPRIACQIDTYISCNSNLNYFELKDQKGNIIDSLGDGAFCSSFSGY